MRMGILIPGKKHLLNYQINRRNTRKSVVNKMSWQDINQNAGNGSPAPD
jgi:hypothetical protein